MLQQRQSILIGVFAFFGAIAPVGAQRPGGMMGMHRDSATMAQMATVHEMVMYHDRITRTVTNLPDGVRTVTESDDPQIARRIKEHVSEMYARVMAADDPGLPIESPALRTIYRNGDKISTAIDTTARGIIIRQTSRDSVTVAALQQHAVEVSELTRDGMEAMHRAMMKNNQGMMGPGRMRGRP